MPVIPPSSGGGGGGSLTVQEADGSPSGTASVIVMPNGSLAVSSGTATYTEQAADGIVVQEVDGSPSGTATVLVVSNGSLTFSNGTATIVTGGGSASNVYSDHVLGHAELVHYWRMNEAAGASTAVDSAGTVNLTVTAGTARFGGPSLVGDADGGCVALGGDSIGTLSGGTVSRARPWTIEGWVSAGNDAEGAWFGQHDATNGPVFYHVGGYQDRGYPSISAFATSTTTQALWLGRHYFALTCTSGGTAIFYVDGTAVGTVTGGTDFGSTPFQVADYKNSAGVGATNALYSDIAVYDDVLDAAEIATHWSNGTA